MTFAVYAETEYTMENVSIHILDDDVYFGRCLQKSLQTTNHVVRHFKTARNFLKALELGPQIIVLDHHLENGVGLEVIDAVQKRGIDAYMLYVSSQDNVHITLSAYQKGVLAYFEKNQYTFENVVSAIRWIRIITQDFKIPLDKNQYRKTILGYTG